MAAPFQLHVTAAQVGTYFVGQYYHVLQHQPEFVHHFYSEMSTMLRFDGNTREAAAGMLQIHALATSLNYAGIEINNVHSLESWNGGVVVMVSGSVLLKDFMSMRKFVQTIFLAPQEKGYFVLNDIFHFLEESIHHHPIAYLSQTQNNLDSKLNASIAVREPVSNYTLNGDIQARKVVPPANIEENSSVDNFSYPEQRLQQVVPEAQNVVEENFAVQSNDVLQNTLSPVQEHPMNPPAQERLPTPIKEPVEAPQKHTYASILQVAKGKSAPSVTPQPSSDNTAHPPVSEWHQIPEPPADHYGSQSGAEVVEEAVPVEYEGEITSVYVRNIPHTVSATEIGEEFKKFGKLKPDGVAIRTRKDMDVYYAFVEFEDITGVQNAVKASTVEISGQQVYIEERRANRSSAFRGGRGRGRGGRGNGYQMEAPRGRFGHRNFGRVNGQDGGERDYSNRPRGNGYYRQAPRQPVSRNGGWTEPMKSE